MKKNVLLILALFAGCLVATASHAAQDRSFTNINSAGMFEEVYDLFKYSPAYLPSFQQSTLWTQLSNLYDASDELMDGTGASYLVLGGQTDLMGMGRAGLLLDWDSDIAPYTNGVSGTGFASETEDSFLDNDSDGITETQIRTSIETEKANKTFSNDIYVAYGMGGFMGLDAGVAFRAAWKNYSPSYNDWYSDASFKEKYEQHTYDYPSGTETSNDIYERSGHLDYGYARYDLILGARSKSLIPNLDLVANLGGILQPYGNDYEYTYERTIDSDLSTTGSIYQKYTEIGIEPSAQGITSTSPLTYDGLSQYYPGTGLGGLINIRGDYQWSQNIMVIGEAGFEIMGRGITDAKQDRESIDRNTHMSGSSLYMEETVSNNSDEYEGSVSDASLGMRLRGIYQGQGWRLGMGIQAAVASSTSERTTTTSNSSITTISGRPDPAGNSTTTTFSGLKSTTITRSNIDALSFPIGLQIDVFENMPIYFGAEHQITVSESSTSYEVKERTPQTITSVDGNGVASTITSEVSAATDASSTSVVTSNHDTYFYYGLTWWPKENIQIDMKNVYRIDYWRDFELSFTFHF